MGTSVGIDFPAMAYRLAHQEKLIPVEDYPKNRFLRFLLGDLMWFLCVDNKRRFGTWPGWFNFLDSRTAFQICSLRDPGPIMGYMLENVALLLNRKRLRERFRFAHPGARNR